MTRLIWKRGVALTVLTLGLSLSAKAADGRTADQAIDAFHRAFYNPDMKLYAIDTDKMGRAAIWVQAIYWDMMQNAYRRNHDKRYRQLIGDIYQGAYEQYAAFDWTNHIEWFIYDDMMWWIISLGRAYELTGEPRYLAHSADGFAYVWQQAYDSQRGGIWWNFKHDAKMACINYPTVVAAMTLYRITRDPAYLAKAKAVYAWATRVFTTKGDGRVADNMHYHFQRPNGMDIDFTTQLYNQGTYIGAATMLFRATADSAYLRDAIHAADYTRYKMCDSDGLLPYKNGVEQGIYAAIFAQYIHMLIYEGGQHQYLPWMSHNAQAAWGHRDPARGLTYKDTSHPCPTGRMESYDASVGAALLQLFR